MRFGGGDDTVTLWYVSNTAFGLPVLLTLLFASTCCCSGFARNVLVAGFVVGDGVARLLKTGSRSLFLLVCTDGGGVGVGVDLLLTVVEIVVVFLRLRSLSPLSCCLTFGLLALVVDVLVVATVVPTPVAGDLRLGSFLS